MNWRRKTSINSKTWHVKRSLLSYMSKARSVRVMLLKFSACPAGDFLICLVRMVSRLSILLLTLRLRRAMSSQSVIADTGPLITLIGAGQLTLLPRLYGAVVIPRQVLDEYNNGATRTDPDLETLIWMSIVDTVTLDPTLPAELGPGERAAISLAVAVSARLVLIDETRARNIARRKGLQIAGTLAVLL